MTDKAIIDQVVYKEAQVIAPPSSGGIEESVGNTPLIALRRLTAELPSQVSVYAKAEWFNPGGSIKDRPALNIIRTALAEGSLTPGKHLLDASSGNTAIAYATFGAALEIPVTLVMPANASPERITILRALGAELMLTDPEEGIDGAIRKVRALLERHPERYFHANQYDNPANWQAHYMTTGPEIVQQTRGKVTHFVAGMGTAGTLTGVGRYLRHYNPAIQIIAGQPSSPMHGIEGIKHMATSIRPAIFNPDFPDRTLEVSTEQAASMVRRLAREEGLFVGISSGANVHLALTLARELQEGVVVTVFPDAGYKYLSQEALWGLECKQVEEE
ncbi:MAG: PLP-dependent cysteine synthase family protein [Anaerolineales bacterium]|jgi:cysteine synthase B